MRTASSHASPLPGAWSLPRSNPEKNRSLERFMNKSSSGRGGREPADRYAVARGGSPEREARDDASAATGATSRSAGSAASANAARAAAYRRSRRAAAVDRDRDRAGGGGSVGGSVGGSSVGAGSDGGSRAPKSNAQSGGSKGARAKRVAAESPRRGNRVKDLASSFDPPSSSSPVPPGRGRAAPSRNSSPVQGGGGGGGGGGGSQGPGMKDRFKKKIEEQMRNKKVEQRKKDKEKAREIADAEEREKKETEKANREKVAREERARDLKTKARGEMYGLTLMKKAALHVRGVEEEAGRKNAGDSRQGTASARGSRGGGSAAASPDVLRGRDQTSRAASSPLRQRRSESPGPKSSLLLNRVFSSDQREDGTPLSESNRGFERRVETSYSVEEVPSPAGGGPRGREIWRTASEGGYQMEDDADDGSSATAEMQRFHDPHRDLATPPRPARRGGGSPTSYRQRSRSPSRKLANSLSQSIAKSYDDGGIDGSDRLLLEMKKMELRMEKRMMRMEHQMEAHIKCRLEYFESRLDERMNEIHSMLQMILSSDVETKAFKEI